MDYKSLENRGCVLHIGRFRFWRPIPTAALWRAKVGWLCAVNARVMRKFAFGPDGHAHATLNDNVAGLSNANNESEELRAHWRVLRAIWVAQDDTPFTLDGPFRLNPPSQGLGRQKRRGRRQRRAGALSPAPAATAAAPPPASAPTLTPAGDHGKVAAASAEIRFLLEPLRIRPPSGPGAWGTCQWWSRPAYRNENEI